MANIISRLIGKGNGAAEAVPLAEPVPEPTIPVDSQRRIDRENARAKRDVMALLSTIRLLADQAENRLDDIE